MSVLQMKHNESKLFESEKYIDEEYTVTCKKISRLPHNLVQYWVDTGHLPPQLHINTVYSDAGSSLSEEEPLYKQYTICNTMLKDKLNDKQLCNNSSSNSSVDTAAYVLSNTNVKKKGNIYSRFLKKDKFLKIHKDMNCKNYKIDTAGNIYDTIDSNISNKKYAFDMYSSNEIYQKDKDLEGTNIIERNGLNLSTVCKEEIAEMCTNDIQINKDELKSPNKEFVKNAIEMGENITNVKKNSALFEDLHKDSVRQVRQKKLYVDRESPIDINMSIVVESINTDINEEKRNLHPAYRNSPLLKTSSRKYVPKKRKYNFLLKNSRIISREDSSSDSSTNDNTDVKTHHAKRQKSLEDLKDHTDETQFFPTISQISAKDKLRQSCREMEKQMKRFPTSEFTSNTKFDKQNVPYVLRSRAKIQGKIMQEETNIKTVSCNILNKMHYPVVLLERLSETTIKRYTNRNGLQSENTRQNSASIKNVVKETNNPNYRACSVMLEKMSYFQLKDSSVHSVNSDTSTIIIYNNMNPQSTNSSNSDTTEIISNSMPLSNSGKTEKNQLKTFSNDMKLTQMRPVVLLERLHYTESSTNKPLCRLDNLNNKLQPRVVLDTNSNCNINILTYNEFNKTKASERESKETNKRKDRSNEHNTKLLYFTTNMTSDSDSDVSSTKCTFNLNSYMKSVSKNKTINQKSFHSLKINISEDFENIKDKRKNFSKEENCGNKHISMHDSLVHMSTDNERCFPRKVSNIQKKDNLLHNFNKSGNNKKKVHASTNIQLKSDESEKDKSIIKNSVKDTVNIDVNKKNKRNKFVFVTKVFDSDSD